MASSLFTEGMARASAAHPWRTVVAWVIVFFLAGGLAGTFFFDTVTTEIKFLNDPESERAEKLVEDRLQRPTSVTDLLIVRSTEQTVDDAGFQQAVEGIADKITALGAEVVTAARSYYVTQDESQVSDNRRSTIVPIVLAGGTAGAEENIAEVHKAIDETTFPNGFEVFITGEATLAREFTVGAEEDLVRGEAIGIPGSAYHPRSGVRSCRCRGHPYHSGDRRNRRSYRPGSRHWPGRRDECFRTEHDHDDRPRSRDRLFAVHRVTVPRGAGKRHPHPRRYRHSRRHCKPGCLLQRCDGSSRAGRPGVACTPLGSIGRSPHSPTRRTWPKHFLSKSS